jgi:hypothetical protein
LPRQCCCWAATTTTALPPPPPLPPRFHPHRRHRFFDGSEGLGAFAYNKPTKKEKRGNMAPISFIEIIYIY